MASHSLVAHAFTVPRHATAVGYSRLELPRSRRTDRTEINDINATPPDPAPLATADEIPLDPHDFTYSIVVPVYNSAGQVGDTVDRIVAEVEGQGLRYELILVNDGSSDGTGAVAPRAGRGVEASSSPTRPHDVTGRTKDSSSSSVPR